jgi:cobalt/nickel transport system permease protein
MVGMLLVRSFDRAQRVHNAMLCRGFKGNLYSLSKFSLNKRDVASLILMATVMLILGILEWKKTI